MYEYVNEGDSASWNKKREAILDHFPSIKVLGCPNYFFFLATFFLAAFFLAGFFAIAF